MKTMKKKLNAEESGQALVELAMTFVVMCVMITGIIDFGRAFYAVQVMKNLAGEGSAMASEGTSATLTAQTVVTDAGSDLGMSTKGCVIVTTVGLNSSNNAIVTGQAKYGSSAGTCAITATSKICSGTCAVNSSATIPTAALNALRAEPTGSSINVTEVFYNFNTVTGVANLLGANVLPSQLYAVAYY